MTYTLYRLALLVLAVGGVWLLLRNWLFAGVLGTLIAAMLSYLLLRGPRDASAAWLAARAASRAPKVDEDAAFEDAVGDGEEPREL